MNDVRVESQTNEDGTVAWDIWIDGKHHGGGLREPSHGAAYRQAMLYVIDVAQLEYAAENEARS